MANRNKEVDAFVVRVNRLHPTPPPTELQAMLEQAMKEAGEEVHDDA